MKNTRSKCLYCNNIEPMINPNCEYLCGSCTAKFMVCSKEYILKCLNKSTPKQIQGLELLWGKNLKNKLIQRITPLPKLDLTNKTLPIDCKKFNKCSAMICPLDKKWKLRSHIKGESTCALLLTLKKKNGLQVISKYLKYDDKLINLILNNYDKILERWGQIRQACKKAVLSPAKLGTRPSQF